MSSASLCFILYQFLFLNTYYIGFLSAEQDCSFIVLDTRTRIEPLRTCINSQITDCIIGTKGDVTFQTDTYWPNDRNCTGPIKRSQKLTNVVSYQCDSNCFIAELLPEPPSLPSTDIPTNIPSNIPTVSPTDIPTISPITSNPTINPTTYRPTIFGETRAPTIIPSVLPTQIPSILLTKVPTASPKASKDAATGSEAVYSVHNNSDNKLFSLPAIPIEIICVLITFLLFIGLIYHLLMPSKSKWAKKIIPKIKITVLLTFISNIIGIICIMIISFIMAANEWNAESYNMSIIPYYILAATYSFGKFCLESFFVIRVYNAFRKSAFRLSKTLCIALFICMFIISFTWCFMFILFIGGGHDDMPYFVYLILAIFEAIFILFLLYLFAKRLAALLILQKNAERTDVSSSTKSSEISTYPSSDVTTTTSSSIVTINSDINGVAVNSESKQIERERIDTLSKSNQINTKRNTSKSVESDDIKLVQSNLSAKQRKLIYLITRCLLLSSVSLITTTMFGFYAFYWSQFGGNYIFILYALWSCDMAINCISLYLNFIFSDYIYKKCCKLCHDSCQNVMRYMFARKILKNDLNELELSQNMQHQEKQSTL